MNFHQNHRDMPYENAILNERKFVFRINFDEKKEISLFKNSEDQSNQISPRSSEIIRIGIRLPIIKSRPSHHELDGKEDAERRKIITKK